MSWVRSTFRLYYSVYALYVFVSRKLLNVFLPSKQQNEFSSSNCLSLENNYIGAFRTMEYLSRKELNTSRRCTGNNLKKIQILFVTQAVDDLTQIATNGNT